MKPRPSDAMSPAFREAMLVGNAARRLEATSRPLSTASGSGDLAAEVVVVVSAVGVGSSDGAPVACAGAVWFSRSVISSAGDIEWRRADTCAAGVESNRGFSGRENQERRS